MNWQSIIAGIIVALAATWLARRMLRIMSGGGKGQVGSCGTCTNNREVGDGKQLVELGKRKDS